MSGGIFFGGEARTRMRDNNVFQKEFLKIALPVALQGVLQSSFSVVDQIMVGQLGSIAIAGIGLGGKFSSLYSVVLAAVATAAGIMIAQYAGNEDMKSLGRSFYQNFMIMLALAGGFMLVSVGFPTGIMGLYSEDLRTVQAGAAYLRIVALSFLPMAVTSIYAVLLRCKDAASLPLYASVGAALLNTVLNYGLIFGKLGMPELGIRGAALATVISQLCGCAATVILFSLRCHREKWKLVFSLAMGKSGWKQYMGILLPILACEFFWSLGENVYAAVYGHIGTAACAAMTLTNPVQALMMGALTGVSQSAGILVGKELGRGNYEEAYGCSKKLMKYGFAASVVLSACLVMLRGEYVRIFQVEENVRLLTQRLLLAYALAAPVKVQNMILGGGIIRSGGKTKYVMAVDMIGTWVFGVPLACITAFVLKMPVYGVYFILSQEELVRFLISVRIFRKKSWMHSLETEKPAPSDLPD